jgi:hypothetical protein
MKTSDMIEYKKKWYEDTKARKLLKCCLCGVEYKYESQNCRTRHNNTIEHKKQKQRFLDLITYDYYI